MNASQSDDRFSSSGGQAFREARRYRLSFFTLSIGVPILLGFGIDDVFHGRTLEAFFGFFLGIVILISLLVLKRNRTAFFFFIRVILFLLGVLLLNLVHSLNQQIGSVLWCYLYPLVVYFMFGKREGTLWILAFCGFTAGLLLVPLGFSEQNGLSSFQLRFLISLAAVSALSYLFIKVHEETLQQLEDKHQRMLDSEKRYRAAYETLKETQAQLVQSGKLAAIGQLAAGVAHELNQPLMVARTIAQLVLRGLDKQALSPENMRERIESIEKSTTRMMKIINHLRIFSRHSPEAFLPVDVNSIVTESLLMMREQLRVHNIELKLELSKHLPTVMGNANQLEQVFLNVIANARDTVLEAMTVENGSGVIEVITRIIGKRPEWVEVLVTDTGKGISSNDLDRVFEPFFTTKDVGKGTGLGLSISHGIVKEHGGTIDVIGTGPEGTVFNICLPIFDDKAE